MVMRPGQEPILALIIIMPSHLELREVSYTSKHTVAKFLLNIPPALPLHWEPG